MNPVQLLMAAVLLMLVSSPASTQLVTSEDRVFSGNANLSTMSKEAGAGGMRDENLRRVLENS
jgi:hypothetical protein